MTEASFYWGDTDIGDALTYAPFDEDELRSTAMRILAFRAR